MGPSFEDVEKEQRYRAAMQKLLESSRRLNIILTERDALLLLDPIGEFLITCEVMWIGTKNSREIFKSAPA